MSVVVRATVDEELADEIAAQAAEFDVPKAWVVRRALRTLLFDDVLAQPLEDLRMKPEGEFELLSPATSWRMRYLRGADRSGHEIRYGATTGPVYWVVTPVDVSARRRRQAIREAASKGHTWDGLMWQIVLALPGVQIFEVLEGESGVALRAVV